jgi:hypothetical protein
MCDITKEVEAAKALYDKITCRERAAADQSLTDSQWRALIFYLPQQNFVLCLGIEDTGGLLGHFFMDVQMGSQLKASRIKQAISVVLLFVY